MKIDDNELKRLLKEGMEYEADLIMREVESDPNMKELVAPEDLHTDLWKQIREHEEDVEKEKAEQEKEEQEAFIEAQKEKKEAAKELTEEMPMEEILTLEQAKTDVQKEVQNIVDKMKLVAEDMKGAVVDKSV